MKRKPRKHRKINAAADTFAPIAMMGDLEITAAGDDKKAPTFKMNAYNGGLLRLAGWDYPVVVELAGLTIPSQTLPVRLQHDARQGVGHTTHVAKTQSKLAAEGVISRDTLWARDVINSSKNGFPWQVSMGADPNEVMFVAEKQQFKANGQTFDGPAYLVSKSTLGELSFVDLGADTTTSAAIAAENQHSHNRKELRMTLKQLRLLAQKFDGRLTKEQLESAILAAAEADEDDKAFTARLEKIEAESKTDKKPDASKKIEAAKPADGSIDAAKAQEIAAAAVAAENTRQKTIRAEAAGLGISDSILAECIDDPAITIEAARAKFLGEVRTKFKNNVNAAPAGIVVDKDIQGTQVIEAAAYLSCGIGDEQKALKLYGEKTLEAAAKFRQLGVQDLFRLAAQAEGKTLPMISAGKNDFIRAAFSVTSLPGILSNLANKSLLEGYLYGEEEWRKICKRGTVNDFKPHTRYRLGADFQYKKVGPGGELKHGELSEQSYSVQADTEGIVIALTRQMIINDDLNAFAQLPFDLGLGANEAINVSVWELLEDNSDSFFAAANANLPTPGAGNALSMDALAIAEKAFLDQTKPNGKPLGIKPAVLAVPTALFRTAQELMKSPMVNGSTTANKFLPTTNVYVGRWDVVCSAYLSSASSWYLFADPMRLAAIEVAFLNGVDRPTIESGQPNFDTLGIQMRAFLDFGTAKQDPRAAQKMATS